MGKQIVCVFQDCVLCGDRGKKLKRIILDKKLDVRKVSFASPEGRKLISEAIFSGHSITLPFFTDGKKFSNNIEDLFKKTPKNTKKVRLNEEKKKHGATK